MFNNIYSQKQEIEALYEQAAASNEELNSYIKELDKTKEELNQKNIELMTLFDNIPVWLSSDGYVSCQFHRGKGFLHKRALPEGYGNIL